MSCSFGSWQQLETGFEQQVSGRLAVEQNLNGRLGAEAGRVGDSVGKDVAQWSGLGRRVDQSTAEGQIQSACARRLHQRHQERVAIRVMVVGEHTQCRIESERRDPSRQRIQVRLCLRRVIHRQQQYLDLHRQGLQLTVAVDASLHGGTGVEAPQWRLSERRTAQHVEI
mgnify:CR=1 FL=1